MTMAPLTLLLSAIILWIRIGPWGIFSIFLITLTIPMQSFFAKKSALCIFKKNIVADRKSKLINEVIEGIRMIKMYGWEISFKKMIDELRSKEIMLYIKRAIISSIESGLSNSA